MPFRAIIVGGGPGGLAMAYSLHLANIDFVLLERRDTIVDPGGATILVNPEAARIFDQFGILEQAEEDAAELGSREEIGPGGKTISRADIFDTLVENHGYPSIAFSRPGLLRVLHDNLPPKAASSVRVNAAVETLTMTDDKVTVQLADGATETGDIIIAADGVHSKIRRLVVEAEPDAFDGKAGHTEHSYKILFGRSEVPAHLKTKDKEGVFYVRHDVGWFVQLGVCQDALAWGMYERPENGTTPTAGRENFTEDDINAFLQKYRHELIWEEAGYTVGDLWDNREAGFLDWMDEGCAKHWHHKRAVFIGDAVAKVNPSQAHGGNMAIESAVCLANELQPLIARTQQPTQAELSAAFEGYRKMRVDKMEALDKRSRAYCELESWSSPTLKRVWAVINFLIRYRTGVVTDVLIGPMRKRSMILDYVPFKERKGRIGWMDMRQSAVAPVLKIWQMFIVLVAMIIGWRLDIN